MTIQEVEGKIKRTSKSTAKSTGKSISAAWNIMMDLIYLVAIVTVVSVAVYVAYQNGATHPAILWAGEKIGTVWLSICQYFKVI